MIHLPSDLTQPTIAVLNGYAGEAVWKLALSTDIGVALKRRW